jgi:hypothetical protein
VVSLYSLLKKVYNKDTFFPLEFGPVKTVLYSNRGYASRNEDLEISCNASASPLPKYFLMEIEKKQYNSSNGILVFNVTAATPDIAISCIPWNKHGRGPMKKIILPVYGEYRVGFTLSEKLAKMIEIAK